MNLSKLREIIQRAIQLLEELEQALDSGDNRKIGARLHELRLELRRALREVTS
jgi:flagellin-specific chaperone FliS